MKPMLAIQQLSKEFGGLRAVNNVSLTLQPGQIVGLIGPNGSGKSTLLNLIDGTHKPTGGRILFNGRDITRLPPEAIYHLGIGRTFQDPALFFEMTVYDNAVLAVKNQRGETPWNAPRRRTWVDEEREHSFKASAALAQVNLTKHLGELASNLSGGQMKLLEIARSTMGDSRLLLLDEPTAGIAPALAYQIFEQIDRLRREQGLTFLIVEHRLDILFDFVDMVYVMHQGALMMHGTPDEIAADPQVREVYLGN